MNLYERPTYITNWIAGEPTKALSGESFEKFSPHTGKQVFEVARSDKRDVDKAVIAAKAAQADWAETPAVKRGVVLHELCNLMEANASLIAEIVAEETGKSLAEASGETAGAIALGRFYAGEGQRLYGRTTTSGVADKFVATVRQPCGVAGLIIAANTPIANVAWKVFPALICGNGVVLKAAEDTPATAWIFAKIAHDVALPRGVLNVVQGFGLEAGAPLVENEDVDVISFTGSTCVGRWIAETAGKRLAKVSLELGGKNPMLVCEDADIDNAVNWASLSAFSNAGQRCASGSRIIVHESVYDEFKKKLVNKAKSLKLGPEDTDDLGPVINEKQLNNMLSAIEAAKADGVSVLAGGARLNDEAHRAGCYLAPTVIEGATAGSAISTEELFGPILVLYKVSSYLEGVELANNSPYGLTASIHTRNFDRAMNFVSKVKSGVATVNGGTYGSEPHMPFGGLKQSGNGSREPGTEALDIYSELKDLYLLVQPAGL